MSLSLLNQSKDTSLQSTQNHKRKLSRRGLEKLDLLLLAIESLDFNASEAMLVLTDKLGIQAQFPNRVELWKRRCHNPLRRASRRGSLEIEDIEAFTKLICSMSERLNPVLSQLLSSREPEHLSQQRWDFFSCRLRDLIEARMNPKRGAVRKLLNPQESNPQFRSLILTLALSSGQGGIDRLRASLLDASP